MWSFQTVFFHSKAFDLQSRATLWGGSVAGMIQPPLQMGCCGSEWDLPGSQRRLAHLQNFNSWQQCLRRNRCCIFAIHLSLPDIVIIHVMLFLICSGLGIQTSVSVGPLCETAFGRRAQDWQMRRMGGWKCELRLCGVWFLPTFSLGTV